MNSDFIRVKSRGGQVSAPLSWLLYDRERNQLIAMEMMARGDTCRIIASQVIGGVGMVELTGGGLSDTTIYCMGDKSVPYRMATRPLEFDHERISVSTVWYDSDDYMVTTMELLEEDLYSQLMLKYDLPLLKKWVPAIRERMEADGCLSIQPAIESNVKNNDGKSVREMRRGYTLYYNGDPERMITDRNGRKIALKDLVVIRCTTRQAYLDEIISSLLLEGTISLTESMEMDRNCEPVRMESLDDFLIGNHEALIENLSKRVHPLSTLGGRVDALALLEKSLYPPQGESVNGIVMALEAGSTYLFLTMEMGVGKTIQSICAVESFNVRKWLKKHPGKTVRDCYLDKDAVNYRTAVVCPNHLLLKWKAEIESQIPYSKVTLITSFSQVTKLAKEKKKKPKGRQFYLFGRDFFKLGYTYGPIPTVVKTGKLPIWCCNSCLEAKNRNGFHSTFHPADPCPACGEKNWKLSREGAVVTGLACPSCGEILSDAKGDPMRPEDFTTRNQQNKFCRYCDAPLWGAEVTPIGPDGEKSREAEKHSVWKKMKFFSTHQRSSTRSVYVMKGRKDYLLAEPDMASVPRDKEGDITISDPKGIRRYSPAEYLKRHVEKGFFDFLIVDEAHQYSNNSAQTAALHCMTRISHFHLCLSGTLSNGTASSAYSLLFMLDNKKLTEKGYGFGKKTEFVRQYGTIEETYERREGYSLSTSRGHMIGSPVEKPGISIGLFIDFFVEHSVMLTVRDFNAILPDFKEEVVTVPLDPEVSAEYSEMTAAYKQLLSSREEGMGKLLGQYRNISLFWPDKPREMVIMHPLADTPILEVKGLPEKYTGSTLQPKEEKLVELVTKERAEGRKVVVFAECTGKPEGRVTERLVDILTEHAGVDRKAIRILEAEKVKTIEREDWMRRQAENGMQVMIANPRCVETGMDFIFPDKDGNIQNFPTLIYFEIGYSLATLWQSSRRAYRLIQTEECRVYYLAYEDTLAVTCLEMLANKEYAASVLQGSFSQGALAAMANAVDPRVRIAQALNNGDYGNAESINKIFRKINDKANIRQFDIEPAPGFYELTGLAPVKEEDVVDAEEFTVLDFMDYIESQGEEQETPKDAAENAEQETQPETETETAEASNGGMDDKYIASDYSVFFGWYDTDEESKEDIFAVVGPEKKEKRKGRRFKKPVSLVKTM